MSFLLMTASHRLPLVVKEIVAVTENDSRDISALDSLVKSFEEGLAIAQFLREEKVKRMALPIPDPWRGGFLGDRMGGDSDL